MGNESTMSHVEALLQKESLEHLRLFCRVTSASFQEGHKMTRLSHEDSRKVMVWLGGLMGAGTLSAYGLLGTAPQATRLTILISWIAGVFSATLCTVLAGEVAERNDKKHFSRISLLELLQIQDDKEKILTLLPSVVDSSIVAADRESVLLNRWRVATNVAFYLAHILFMMGITAAATALIAPWK
jgi:hypothetical protein